MGGCRRDCGDVSTGGLIGERCAHLYANLGGLHFRFSSLQMPRAIWADYIYLLGERALLILWKMLDFLFLSTGVPAWLPGVDGAVL